MVNSSMDIWRGWNSNPYMGSSIEGPPARARPVYGSARALPAEGAVPQLPPYGHRGPVAVPLLQQKVLPRVHEAPRGRGPQQSEGPEAHLPTGGARQARREAARAPEES